MDAPPWTEVPEKGVNVCRRCNIEELIKSTSIAIETILHIGSTKDTTVDVNMYFQSDLKYASRRYSPLITAESKGFPISL